jgi:hypothetical protein
VLRSEYHDLLKTLTRDVRARFGLTTARVPRSDLRRIYRPKVFESICGRTSSRVCEAPILMTNWDPQCSWRKGSHKTRWFSPRPTAEAPPNRPRVARLLLRRVERVQSHRNRRRDFCSGTQSIFERARAVRAQLEYHELYWTFCLHKHTVPTVTGAIASGDAELVYGPNITGVYEGAWYSTFCFVKLCDIYQRARSLGLDARLKTVSDTASAARDAVFASHPKLCTSS